MAMTLGTFSEPSWFMIDFRQCDEPLHPENDKLSRRSLANPPVGSRQAMTTAALDDWDTTSDAPMLRFAQLMYLMLPVYMANMAPPFVRYWPGWNRPINSRWLGSHKTIVGFVAGVAVATMTTFLQSLVMWRGGLAQYDQWPALGLACGFGAMGGDTLKSLIKRRLGIVPGKPWIPADQLDFVAGGLVALSPFVTLRPVDVVLILAVSFLGDLGVNQLSFRLGIRDTK